MFWAAFVVVLGCGLILLSHVVSYDILFGLGLSWPMSAILSFLVSWGMILLWGPTILLIVVSMADLRPGLAYLRRAIVRRRGQATKIGSSNQIERHWPPARDDEGIIS